MDMTITGIGAVVVAELPFGWLPGVDDWSVREGRSRRWSATGVGAAAPAPTQLVGGGFRVVDDQPSDGPVQCPTPVGLSAVGGGVRLLRGDRAG